MSVCSRMDMLMIGSLSDEDDRRVERVEIISLHCEEEGESLSPSLVSDSPSILISLTRDAVDDVMLLLLLLLLVCCVCVL